MTKMSSTDRVRAVIATQPEPFRLDTIAQALPDLDKDDVCARISQLVNRKELAHGESWPDGKRMRRSYVRTKRFGLDPAQIADLRSAELRQQIAVADWMLAQLGHCARRRLGIVVAGSAHHG